MTHTLKLWKEFADDVFVGKKTFEIRNNTDRIFNVGDKVEFQVVDLPNGSGEVIDHPLNRCTFLITFTLNGWGLSAGYTAFSIRLIDGIEKSI